MVRDGPPLSGGGDGGYDRVNGCHSVGAANWLSVVIACMASWGAEWDRGLAKNNGVAQIVGAGDGCRWHGGRAAEDWSQGITAQGATHWALASKESRSNATTGNFRQRIPVVRIQQTAGYQPIRCRPATKSNCPSRLSSGRPCWRARAAIQRSFDGIGRPRCFSSLRTLA